MDARALEVVAFRQAAGRERWFSKNEGFDQEFRSRFLDLHFAAARRELDHWMLQPEGALALLVLLDQLPRNCFRGTAHMFATDPLARHFARHAVDAGHDQATGDALRFFFYLPFGHSEDIVDQDEAVRLCTRMAGEYLKYALMHRDIIARFGRFPHRNAIVGRATTPEEQDFLDRGGFAG